MKRNAIGLGVVSTLSLATGVILALRAAHLSSRSDAERYEKCSRYCDEVVPMILVAPDMNDFEARILPDRHGVDECVCAMYVPDEYVFDDRRRSNKSRTIPADRHGRYVYLPYEE